MSGSFTILFCTHLSMFFALLCLAWRAQTQWREEISYGAVPPYTLADYHRR